ncbi:hypothetical protein ELQ35_20865 [Peribacillus cavernae]|uniref:Uncharacterized protein n=1 Tax=Peribacillus cavernae TaxID=1674310 RepID=A0A3S0W2K4_9BACI|nr:hypothetical protein [Peribacillus cavernae]MDQ0221250.1 hypothetical protein [Peribacillus cavernae]RUQ25120.1 hypothetical protein ELQ35_20865 [Peribacillus cavernae]
MLKIEQDIKRRRLPQHIKEQLDPFSTMQIKFVIASGTFFMLDLLIILPLLVPVIKAVLFITLPLLIFISLWAIWLLVRKAEDTELESLLFLGCLGIVGSICYFVLSLKYSFMLGIDSPLYYFISIVIFGFIIFLFIRHQVKRYSSLERERTKETPKWHYRVLSISVPAGYLVAHYIMGLSGGFMLSFMTVVFFGMSIFYIFVLAKYLYKYFFIKTNIHLVRFSNKKLNQRSGIVNGK